MEMRTMLKLVNTKTKKTIAQDKDWIKLREKIYDLIIDGHIDGLEVKTK